jgi:hypothetical protein
MKNSEFCKWLGCSGMSEKCPGNPECEIIQRLEKEKKNVNIKNND